MKRILALSTWPSLYPMAGGGGTPIEGDLYEALLGAGHELTIVAPRAGHEDFPAGARVVRLPPARPLRGPGPLRRLGAWRSLTRALEAEGARLPADLVYGIGGFAVPAAARVGARLSVPSIGLILGTFLAPAMHSRLRLALAFEEVRAFRAPVTVLEVLDDGTRGDEVAERLGVTPERLRFWMHGVDRAACEHAVAERGGARAELGLPADRPLAVSASRLTSWKRVDRILRAWPAVQERVPDALLAISGAGPAEGKLRRTAEPFGDSVRFTGALDRAANLRLIAAADCFCSFYDFSNVGVALLEALSCGVACVVADTGATRRLVRDGESGRVVPADDSAAAARAIAAVLSDPAEREALRAGAASLAAERLMSIEDRRRLEVALVESLTKG